MFPEWFTQPDTIFKTVLWLLSPAYVWLTKKLWKKVQEFNALASEQAARVKLASLGKALDSPPTLLESVAYLVCGLPLPIVSTMMVGSLYFLALSHPLPVYPVDFHMPETINYIFFFVLFFVNYVVFGVLTIYAVQVAYRLRHGEAHYAENYKKGIQKQIDRITMKFPNLGDRTPGASVSLISEPS
jgi:hypothetical protein